MTNRLNSKVTAITGGGGGIGSAAGKIFCEEGGKVALIDLHQETVDNAVRAIKAKVPNADVRGFVADVGIESEADRVVKEIVSAFGGLDVVVNNVGIRRYESVENAPWSAWEDIIRVNLLSFVSMTRAALPHLRKSGKGSIVNVSSTYAVYGRKGMAAYDATKAGVLALTRTTAYEEAEHGIRVNAICPGYTRTPFHVARLGSDAVEALVPPCVMQRWAEPSELAYPMLWLASEEASYVTGATFMIDGGLPA